MSSFRAQIRVVLLHCILFARREIHCCLRTCGQTAMVTTYQCTVPTLECHTCVDSDTLVIPARPTKFQHCSPPMNNVPWFSSDRELSQVIAACKNPSNTENGPTFNEVEYLQSFVFTVPPSLSTVHCYRSWPTSRFLRSICVENWARKICRD